MLILGAGGFAKELLEILLQLDLDEELVFFDNVTKGVPERLFGCYRVLTSQSEMSDHFRNEGTRFVIGAGVPATRRTLGNLAESCGGEVRSVISPFARIGKTANVLAEGVCVLTGAVIESHNTINKGVLVHVNAIVSHDVEIGEFSEISPRATLLGNTVIGKGCKLGAGSIVLPGVKIGDEAVVGAGAVVTADVEPGLVVAGVPAKPLRAAGSMR
ncbi:MAG: acetyltransferase [Acidobacteriota bacterium]|nr:MAG: acetyltransferase [Acidobacteriota bacterium]